MQTKKENLIGNKDKFGSCHELVVDLKNYDLKSAKNIFHLIKSFLYVYKSFVLLSNF